MSARSCADTNAGRTASPKTGWLVGLTLVSIVPVMAFVGTETLPRFERVLQLESAASYSSGVSIGDLDGDGRLDIVLTKGRHAPLVSRVLLGDGHGQFPTARDLDSVPLRSYAAALADVDRDGDLDLVIGNDAPDVKVVYINDGKGGFRRGSTFGRPLWPTRNVTVTDLDGDGLPDIAVANRSADSTSANFICWNRGGGTFDAECTVLSKESATSIAAADFNGDGLVDLVVPHREGGQSYLYLNQGKRDLSTRVPFGPPDAATRMAAAADFDGDSRLDIVAIDEKKKCTFVYFNQGAGTFSEGLRLRESKNLPYALAVGDLNKDGKPDIVVGGVLEPSTVFINDGSGRTFTPITFGDGQGAVYGLSVQDLDGDGRPDIAAARSGAPNVIYFGAP